MSVVGSHSETPRLFCLAFRFGLNSAGTWSLKLTFPNDKVPLFDVEAGVWCAVSAAGLLGLLVMYMVYDKVCSCNPGLKAVWQKVHSLNVVSKNLIWTATHELKCVDPVSGQIEHSYCDLLWFSFLCFVLVLCHCMCVICCHLSFRSPSIFSLYNSLFLSTLHIPSCSAGRHWLLSSF